MHVHHHYYCDDTSHDTARHDTTRWGCASCHEQSLRVRVTMTAAAAARHQQPRRQERERERQRNRMRKRGSKRRREKDREGKVASVQFDNGDGPQRRWERSGQWFMSTTCMCVHLSYVMSFHVSGLIDLIAREGGEGLLSNNEHQQRQHGSWRQESGAKKERERIKTEARERKGTRKKRKSSKRK